MCAKGSKLVLLVTGLCPSHCSYCPLSFKKGGKDVIYADEWQLQDEQDTETILKEAAFIKATGAGITGGDPLVVWKRTTNYIKLLKENFGPTFHIHLYTSGLQQAEHIPTMVKAGLDEIRFHPLPSTWTHMEQSPLQKIIKETNKLSLDVALEIPAFPQKDQNILSLITWADHQHLSWVNLNELEFSERNETQLRQQGFAEKHELSAAVNGSQETAQRVLQHVQDQGLDIGIHYCSVSFKDGIQLKNRLKRRAHTIAKPFEVISKEGLLIKGIIEAPLTSLQNLYNRLRTEYTIPKNALSINTEKQRIELNASLLETIASQVQKQGYRCYLIEEYPTADQLEVERIPLPFS